MLIFKTEWNTIFVIAGSVEIKVDRFGDDLMLAIENEHGVDGKW